jgi:hypothetical protein
MKPLALETASDAIIRISLTPRKHGKGITSRRRDTRHGKADLTVTAAQISQCHTRRRGTAPLPPSTVNT